MKKHKKLLKVIGIIFALIVIVMFIDFVLGGMLMGWNNPK